MVIGGYWVVVVVFLGGSAFWVVQFRIWTQTQTWIRIWAGYGLGTRSRILSVRGYGYDFSRTNELYFFLMIPPSSPFFEMGRYVVMSLCFVFLVVIF